MSAFQGILASPRVNRYLPWAAGFVLLAGLIAFLIAYFTNTVGSNPNSRLSNKPAQTEPGLGRAIAFPTEARRVVAQFIDAAVRGKSATLAWKLSGPAIRAGYKSLAQWKHDWNTVGVPIQPYPASKQAALKVDYAREKEIQLKLFLSPRPGVNEKPQTFLMVLDRFGRGPRSHWLVNNWQTYSPPAIPTP
jgi:hypothetical protein